jgi:hypothetical protein
MSSLRAVRSVPYMRYFKTLSEFILVTLRFLFSAGLTLMTSLWTSSMGAQDCRTFSCNSEEIVIVDFRNFQTNWHLLDVIGIIITLK